MDPKQFPERLPLPEDVQYLRRERTQALIKASWRGVAVRSCIAAIELLCVVVFGSSALFMDALATFVDIAATVLLIFFLKLAERPPDEDHPFGHGRYEPLVGLQLGVLLTVTGAGMLIQQLYNVVSVTETGRLATYLWCVPLAAGLMLEGCYQVLSRQARNRHSAALLAEAYHFRVDALTSFLAAVALLGAMIIPEWGHSVDHLGAMIIAGFMVGLGIMACRENIHQLMDKIPSIDFFRRVRKAAMKVQGVQETEKTRIQLYGPDAHVDIDIEVDPLMSVEVAHHISQRVRLEIQKEWPAVRDVTVHIEPYYPNDH